MRNTHRLVQPPPGDKQFDDLERRDLLRAGGAGWSYRFAALNPGLQAAAENASASRIYLSLDSVDALRCRRGNAAAARARRQRRLVSRFRSVDALPAPV